MPKTDFIAALGILGLIALGRPVGFVELWRTRSGLYTAAALPLGLGLALFLAAPSAKAPHVLRVLGVVLIVAGLATLFLGLERFRRLFEW